MFGALHVLIFWRVGEWVPLLGALCFCAAGAVMMAARWVDVWREGVFAEIVFILLMMLSALSISQTRYAYELAPDGLSMPLIVWVALMFGGVLILPVTFSLMRTWLSDSSG